MTRSGYCFARNPDQIAPPVQGKNAIRDYGKLTNTYAFDFDRPTQARRALKFTMVMRWVGTGTKKQLLNNSVVGKAIKNGMAYHKSIEQCEYVAIRIG